VDLVRGGASAASGDAVLELAPSVPIGPAGRNELTEEAERLVRFIASDANRHDVRWIT
jgi:hypothetical protein